IYAAASITSFIDPTPLSDSILVGIDIYNGDYASAAMNAAGMLMPGGGGGSGGKAAHKGMDAVETGAGKFMRNADEAVAGGSKLLGRHTDDGMQMARTCASKGECFVEGTLVHLAPGSLEGTPIDIRIDVVDGIPESSDDRQPWLLILSPVFVSVRLVGGSLQNRRRRRKDTRKSQADRVLGFDVSKDEIESDVESQECAESQKPPADSVEPSELQVAHLTGAGSAHTPTPAAESIRSRNLGLSAKTEPATDATAPANSPEVDSIHCSTSLAPVGSPMDFRNSPEARQMPISSPIGSATNELHGNCVDNPNQTDDSVEIPLGTLSLVIPRRLVADNHSPKRNKYAPSNPEQPKPPQRSPNRWWLKICLFLAAACMTVSWIAPTGSPTAERTAEASAAESRSARVVQSRVKPIEDIRLGERVAGRNPIREQVEEFEPDPATWKHVRLHMLKDNGRSLWVELLRPNEWFEQSGVTVGGTIDLDLPEMAAQGPAEILYVGPCPEIATGDGTVVTGKFTHESDGSNVINVRLEGEIKPTGVTTNHAIWSANRNGFVAVGDLKEGEAVNTLAGLRRITSIAQFRHAGYLRNIETTEHVFVVSPSAFLVHNSCALTAYSADGGHHIFSKRAFEGVPNYDKDAALCIGNQELERLTLKHLGSDSLSTTQQRLFRELKDSGRANTMTEHIRIAKETLIEHGVGIEEAEQIVKKALNQLEAWNIVAPIHLPWGGY
ncbi:MAG: hypothetical protein JSS02_12420, partial [Planctomycetes bacterium]|nr:hypothetical protein [Planctomycetota bacterium]